MAIQMNTMLKIKSVSIRVRNLPWNGQLLKSKLPGLGRLG